MNHTIPDYPIQLSFSKNVKYFYREYDFLHKHHMKITNDFIIRSLQSTATITYP